MQSDSTEQPYSLTSASDQMLLEAFARRRVDGAFEEIVRRYERVVMSICVRTTNCRPDADDAFQATFFALARRPRQLRRASGLSSWLCTVAWRTSMQVSRRGRRNQTVPLPDDLPAEPVGDPFEAIAQDRALRALNEEIAALPEQYRHVLIENSLLNRSAQQIADESLTTKGVIDGRIKRARRMLRVRLMRRGVTMGVLGLATQMLVAPAHAASAPIVDSTIAGGLKIASGESVSMGDAVARVVRVEASARVSSSIAGIVTTVLAIVAVSGWAPVSSDVSASDQSIVLVATVLDEEPFEAEQPDLSAEVSQKEDVGEDKDTATSEPGDGRNEDREFNGVLEEDLLKEDGEWGGVAGQILWDGELPERSVLFEAGAAVKNGAVAAVRTAFDRSLLVEPRTKGIVNCFVYLPQPPVAKHPLFPKPSSKRLYQDRRACRFEPHTMFIQTGQTVELISSDPIAHNNHIYPLRNAPLNMVLQPMAAAGQGPVWTPTRRESLPFRVSSDFHSWMSAYWLVLDHPYAAVTDAQGRFRIVGLPTGEHELRIWHERTGYLQRELRVQVADGEVTDLPPLKYEPKLFDPRQ